MDLNKLSGAQRDALRKWMVDAFDWNSLEQLLDSRLDKQLEALVEKSSFEDVAFDIIKVSQKEGWTDKLVEALQSERPNKPDILTSIGLLGRGAVGNRSVPGHTIPSDPISFLFWVGRAAPQQTRFILKGVLVLAGAALVIGWMRDLGLALSFTLPLLFVGFGLAASVASKTLVGVGNLVASRTLVGVWNFLAWALAILLVVLLSLMLTSALFGLPKEGALRLAKFLRSKEFLIRIPPPAPPVIVAAGTKQKFGDLPPELRTEPASQNHLERVQELAELPELVIRGDVDMRPGERRTLSASTLRLDSGVLITNGAILTIEANNLISDTSAIRAFGSVDNGEPNLAGRSGGKVALNLYGGTVGSLAVDLRGERGANGAPGPDGKKGAKGAQGDNAVSGAFDCKRGAGRGGKGGTGQNGTDGSPGLPGGRGGDLVVRAADANAARKVIGEPLLEGGAGGAGGPGGKGGPGGEGGDGGSPVGWCSGSGPKGPQGDRGSDGRPGRAGEVGASGSVSFMQNEI